MSFSPNKDVAQLKDQLKTRLHSFPPLTSLTPLLFFTASPPIYRVNNHGVANDKTREECILFLHTWRNTTNLFYKPHLHLLQLRRLPASASTSASPPTAAVIASFPITHEFVLLTSSFHHIAFACASTSAPSATPSPLSYTVFPSFLRHLFSIVQSAPHFAIAIQTAPLAEPPPCTPQCPTPYFIIPTLNMIDLPTSAHAHANANRSRLKKTRKHYKRARRRTRFRRTP